MRKVIGSLRSLLLILVAVLVMGTSVASAEVFSPGVNSPSQEDIAYWIRNHSWWSGDATFLHYKKKASLTPEYRAGVLTDEVQQNVLNLLNTIRYVAGISSDVKLNEECSERASAASLLFYLNGRIDEIPARPNALSSTAYDDLYSVGQAGALSGAHANGYINWLNAMTDGLMDTSYGNRYKLLDPDLYSTGFGAANPDGEIGGMESYYSMYVRLAMEGKGKMIPWPAQNTPYYLFNNTLPWSVSNINIKGDPEQVDVFLTDMKTDKRWYFGNSQALSDGALNVSTDGSVIKSVSFMPPDGVTCNKGDYYLVEMHFENGLSDLGYYVRFFDDEDYLKPVQPSDPESVAKITLNSKSKTVAHKGTYQLKAEGASDIKWKTSNKKVATVSNGKVTGVAPGTATITAYSASNPDLKATCKVTVKYKITYKLNGGTNHADNPKYYNGKSAVSLKKASKAGYAFNGWYLDDKKVTTIEKGTKGNITLTAKWTKCKSIEDAKITLSQTSYTYNGKAKKPAVKVILNDKTLKLDTDYTVTYKNNTYVGTAKVTVTGIGKYADSVTKNYKIKSPGTIKVKFYDGSDLLMLSDYNIGGKFDSLPDFPKKGYIGHWFTKKKEGTEVVVGQRVTQTSDFNLYIRRTPIKYSIMFDSNTNASVCKLQKDVSYGSSVALKDNSFTKDGYDFIGWSKTADGKVAYLNKEKVKNLSSSDGDVVRLYAVWRKPGKAYYCSIAGNTADSCIDQAGAMEQIFYDNKLPGYEFGDWFYYQVNKESEDIDDQSMAPYRDEIEGWIKSSFEKTTDNDISFIYYCGHGKAFRYREDPDVIVGQGITIRPREKSEKDYYTYDDFVEYLGSSIKGKIVFLVDTCFSGGFVTACKNSKYKNRMCVLASSGRDEEAHSTFQVGNMNHYVDSGILGTLCTWLLKHLKPESELQKMSFIIIYGLIPDDNDEILADLDRNGLVTLAELSRFVNDYINKIGGAEQTPQVYLPAQVYPIFGY